MRVALRVGIAIFNVGDYHAAHDAWEEQWLGLPAGTADEQLLHGLIQYSAVLYHIEQENAEGASGLANSALEYLSNLPSTMHGVAVEPVRSMLAAIAIDYTVVHRQPIPPLLFSGTPIHPPALTWDELTQAATILATEETPVDNRVIDAAISLGEADDRFASMVRDFVATPNQRQVIADRLQALVNREHGKIADVSGLFDTDQST